MNPEIDTVFYLIHPSFVVKQNLDFQPVGNLLDSEERLKKERVRLGWALECRTGFVWGGICFAVTILPCIFLLRVPRCQKGEALGEVDCR